MSKKAAFRLFLGAVLPTIIYYIGSKMGAPLMGALAASAWGIAVLGWFLLFQKELDASAAIGAAYAVSEMAGLLVSHNPEWYLYSPMISDAVLGFVFLGSMLLSKPLIQRLAEQMAGLDAFPESIRTGPHYRPVWLRLSLIWAAAYLGKALFKWGVLATMPEEVYLAIRAFTDWPVLMALIAISFRYPAWYWERCLATETDSNGDPHGQGNL